MEYTIFGISVVLVGYDSNGNINHVEPFFIDHNIGIPQGSSIELDVWYTYTVYGSPDELGEETESFEVIAWCNVNG